MAVSLDTTSESHTGTTGSASEASFTWNHGGASSGVKGVTVAVHNASSTTDTVSSVTYGGVTMSAVSGGRAVDTATEPGSTKLYHLGSNVPQGTQAVVVNRTNNADVMYATATTTLAANDTAAVGAVLTQEDGTVAEVSVSDLSGVNSLRLAAGYFGHQTLPTAGASSTLRQSIDFGANGCVLVTETTAGTGSRSVGMSSGTSDDRAIVAVAIREVFGPAVGSLDLSGRAPSLALAIGLLVGSLGLTGLAPTVNVASNAITIAVPAGSLDFSSPFISVNFAGPATGSINLTGYAPTVTVASVTTGVATGGYVAAPAPVRTVHYSPVTGPVFFSSGTTIAIPAGSLDFSSPFISVNFGGPETGSINLTGYAPTINVAGGAGTIAVPAGSLDLTGRAPSLKFVVNQPAGSLDITGLSPNLKLGLAIPAGSLDLTGRAPIVVVSSAGTIAIPAGSVNLTGQAPSLKLVVAQSVGSLGVTGQTPILRLAVAIPVGSLSLTGQAPTIAIGGGNITILIPVGTLDFTGQFVGVAFGPIASGLLDLTGYAPTVVVSGGGTPIAEPGGGLAYLVPKTTVQYRSVTGPVFVPSSAVTPLSWAPVYRVRTETPFQLPFVKREPYFAVIIDVPSLAWTATVLQPPLPIPEPTRSIVVEALRPPTVAIAIPVGTLGLTGQSPILRSVITIPVGSLSLTGLTPSLGGTGVLSIPAGSLDLTGRAPSLAFVNSIPVGGLSLTGQSPSLARTIAIPVGSLNFTGQTPALGGTGVIPIPVGTLNLTGQAPSLKSVVAMPVGSIALTGLAPVAQQDRPIAISVGTLSLTGLAPILRFVVAIPAGSLDITGQAPVLAFAGQVNVPIPAGSLNVVGRTPTLALGIGAQVGSISLTGLAPSLFINKLIAIPAGSLTFFGNPPALLGAGSLTAQPQVGSIALTGYAPLVLPALAIRGDIIDVTGEYKNIIDVTGSYDSAITVTGEP